MHPTPQRVSAAAARCQRIEDARPARRPRPLHRQRRRARRGGDRLPALAATRTRASSRIDADAARAMPGVLGVFTGAELAAAGVKAMPTTPDFRRADGRRTVTPAAPRPGARVRALRRRGDRRGGRRVARARRATRSTAIVVDLRGAAVGRPTRVAASAAGAPRVARRGARQHRRRDAPRRRRRRPRRRSPAPRIGVALDVVNQRLAPAPMEPRCGRRLVSTRRAAGSTVRISNQMPTAVAGGIAASLPDLDAGAGPRPGRRRRRRLRHEDRRLSGRHRSSPTRRGRCKRPVRWQAERSEEFLSAYARPRRRQPCRARARCRRPGAGAARALARQRRRLRHAGRASRSSC